MCGCSYAPLSSYPWTSFLIADPLLSLLLLLLLLLLVLLFPLQPETLLSLLDSFFFFTVILLNSYCCTYTSSAFHHLYLVLYPDLPIPRAYVNYGTTVLGIYCRDSTAAAAWQQSDSTKELYFSISSAQNRATHLTIREYLHCIQAEPTIFFIPQAIFILSEGERSPRKATFGLQESPFFLNKKNLR